jgi:hypothetical protein
VELVMPRASAPRRPAGTRKSVVAAAPPGNAAPRVGKVPHRNLVAELASEFRQRPDRPDPPLVVLDRFPQTRSVHALVIWDKLRDLTIPERSRVIADAFAAAFPNEDVVVRFPMGLTPGEALTSPPQP